MRCAVTQAALAQLVVVLCVTSAFVSADEFTMWMSVFGRSYSTSSELAHARENFYANMAAAAQWNARHPDAEFGATIFSDLSSEEFLALYAQGNAFSGGSSSGSGGGGSRHVVKRTMINESALEEYRAAHSIKRGLPALGTTIKNWCDEGHCRPVHDQGQSRTCQAHSITAMFETYCSISGQKTSELSVQALVDCAPLLPGQFEREGVVNGPAAAAWAMKHGLPNAKNYRKYKGYRDSCDVERFEKHQSMCNTPFTVGTLPHSDTADESIHWYDWIVNRGPISASLDAAVLQTYVGGIIDIPERRDEGVNHQILLVGVGSVERAAYYIGQNSWSRKKGFFRFRRGYDSMKILRLAPIVLYTYSPPDFAFENGDGAWHVPEDLVSPPPRGQFTGNPDEPDGETEPPLPVDTPEPVPSITVSSPLQFFTLASPTRLIDSRDDGGIFRETETRMYNLWSVAGVPLTAAALSGGIIAVDPLGTSYFTVYPSNVERPLASTINYQRGLTVHSSLYSVVSSTGNFKVYAHNARAHLVIDVNGYFAPASDTGLWLHRIVPFRLFDTRDTATPFSQAEERAVPAVGGAVPSYAKAISFSAALPDAVGSSYITVWPEGALPMATSGYANEGIIEQTAGITRIGADGSFRIMSHAQAVNVALDVDGYFAATGPESEALGFMPLTSVVRLFDSRDFGAEGWHGADAEHTLSVAGVVPSNAQVLVCTATATGGESGYVTIWPGGVARPTTSVLQYNGIAQQTMALSLHVPLSATGTFMIYASQPGELIIDVIGYYAPSGLSAAEQMVAQTTYNPERVVNVQTITTYPKISRPIEPPKKCPIPADYKGRPYYCKPPRLPYVGQKLESAQDAGKPATVAPAALVGIVIGSVFVALLLSATAFAVWWRRRTTQRADHFHLVQ